MSLPEVTDETIEYDRSIVAGSFQTYLQRQSDRTDSLTEGGFMPVVLRELVRSQYRTLTPKKRITPVWEIRRLDLGK